MLAPSPLVEQFKNYHFPEYPSVTGLPQPITARSVGEFFFALAWGVLLLVAFVGWGRTIGRLLRVQSLPTSVACSLGIATIIFVGGFLNLAHAIYVPVLLSSTVVGLVLYATQLEQRPALYRWKQFWKAAAPWARFLMIVALIILALRVAATVRLAEFDINDDSAAYLVFPKAMLATHSFAPGPFSDRHVISSLGGGYLLQAFVIAATSLANIGMADRTLGLLLVFAGVWDLAIAFGLTFEEIALLEFVAYLIPQQTSNLTFVILPIALLLSVMWFVFQTSADKTRRLWSYALLAGAVGGAAVTLKSTFLPSVGAFCLFPFLMMNWRRKKLAITLPVIAGVGAILVTAAWMIAMKHVGGAYLYPILGRGVDYSSYGVFSSFKIAQTPRTIIKLFLHAFALLMLGAIFAWLGLKKRVSLFGLSVLLSAAFATTAFNVTSGGDSIWRYDFPTFFSAILIFSIACMALSREEFSPRRKKLAFATAVLSLLGCIFYYDISGANPELFRQAKWEASRYRPALRASLSGLHLASPVILREYQAINAALPSHGTALENVGYPFLLNNKLHQIFLMDWPGAASPKPGWPFGKSSAALARYLQKNSVQYVLYDYRYARWMDAKSCQVMEMPHHYSTELYVLFWMSLLSQNQLDHLRSHYHSIYDDGNIAIIDLADRIPKTVIEEPVWTLATDKDRICSEVMARYLADPLVIQKFE